MYLMLGRNRRKQKRYSGKPRSPKNLSESPADETAPLTKRESQISRLIEGNTGFPLTSDNQAELLKDGSHTFTRIFE